MSIWTDSDGPLSGSLARAGEASPRPAAPQARDARRRSAERPHGLPGPDLRLEEYFAGESRAWGIFQDRFGAVRRQFTVDLDGRWDGRTLTLTEDFAYDDGEAETRVWRLRKEYASARGQGWVGETADAIGPARGAVEGNRFHWRYRFSLAIGAKRLAVAFDDLMVLQPDGVLLNRARVTKFGLLLGEATIAFSKKT
jgi:hypothetical protein